MTVSSDANHPEPPTMANSSNPASPNRDRQTVPKNYESQDVANTSKLVSPNLDNPTMTNTSNQPSLEQELPAMENPLDQASPNQEFPTIANLTSNQLSPVRERPTSANSSNLASPRPYCPTMTNTLNLPSPEQQLPPAMENSLAQASPKQECPTLANSSNHPSPVRDRPTSANSSNLASPQQKCPTVTNTLNLPSPEQQLPPAIDNSLAQASPKQECPTLANSSNHSSPVRERPTSANSSNLASPQQKCPTVTNTSNQLFSKRKRPAMEKSVDQASPKRARVPNTDNVASVTDDRISSLPHRVLIRILEKLPLHTAIMTSLVSKRWTWLWNWMSKLSFDQRSRPAFQDFSIFASFVDATLLLCQSKSIHTISLVMNSKCDFHRKLPLWMGFINNNKNVKELELRCYDTKCELPLTLCVNTSILKLKLEFSEIKLPLGDVCWSSLRCLSLNGIVFETRDMMDVLLVGCPALEELEMDDCEGVYVFDFSLSDSLKKFSMINDQDEPFVHIYCGNLRSLVINDCPFTRRMYYLYDSSLLREVVLILSDELYPFEEKKIDRDNYAKDVISSLLDVHKLTLGGCCLALFAYCSDKSLPSPLPSLRNLAVVCHFTELDVFGLSAILWSCPNLETLTIELDELKTGTMCNGEFTDDIEHDFEPLETYWNSLDFNEFKCLRMSLKTVRITRFGLDECEIDNVLHFVDFILEHALMLEELLVIVEKAGTREKAEERLAGIAQTLLSFKRSSPFVKIVFK